MSVVKKAWKGGTWAKEKYDSAKGKYEVYERIRKLVNQETRSGALLTEGAGALLKLGGRVFGRSLSSHPFFSYYTKHLDLVASALNAANGYQRAIASLRHATTSAGQAQALANLVENYRVRRDALVLEYTLDLRPGIKAGLKEQEDLLDMVRELDCWQQETAYLADDALGLMMMVQAHLRTVEASVARYERKVKAISGLGTIGKFMGKYAANERNFANANGTFDIAMGDDAGNALAMPLATARESFQRVSREAKSCAALATTAAKISEESLPEHLAVR